MRTLRNLKISPSLFHLLASVIISAHYTNGNGASMIDIACKGKYKIAPETLITNTPLILDSDSFYIHSEPSTFKIDSLHSTNLSLQSMVSKPVKKEFNLIDHQIDIDSLILSSDNTYCVQSVMPQY